MDGEFGAGFNDDFGDEFISVEGEPIPSKKKPAAKKKGVPKVDSKQMEDLYAACVNPLVDKNDVVSISEECSGIYAPDPNEEGETEAPAKRASPALQTLHEEGDGFDDDDGDEDDDGDDDMASPGFGQMNTGGQPPHYDAQAMATSPPQQHQQHHHVPSGRTGPVPIHVMQTDEEVEHQERAQLLDDYETMCERGVVDTSDPHHFAKMIALPTPLLRSEVYRMKRKWHSRSQIRLYRKYLITISKIIDFNSHRITQFTFGILRLQGFSDQIIQSVEDNEFDEAFNGIYHRMSKRQMSNPWGSLTTNLLLCGLNAQLNNMSKGPYDTIQQGRQPRPVNDFINTVSAIGSLMGGGGDRGPRGGSSSNTHRTRMRGSPLSSTGTGPQHPRQNTPPHQPGFSSKNEALQSAAASAMPHLSSLASFAASMQQAGEEENKADEDQASPTDLTQSLKNISERYKKKKGQ